MPAEATGLMTAEELERLDPAGKSTELVRDRAPDVAFVSLAHQPVMQRRGYGELAPDLVAEILSPDDRPGEVLSKVGDWLAAGVRLVFVIDPIRRETRVYRDDGTQSLVDDAGPIDGEDVLPGFSCSLGDFLD